MFKHLMPGLTMCTVTAFGEALITFFLDASDQQTLIESSLYVKYCAEQQRYKNDKSYIVIRTTNKYM